MTLKTRISLIACGVAIFLIVAPAAVFFARGYYFDFAARRIIRTGILSVKTDPRGAQVLLNGQQLRDTTPLTKRFLHPGEYTLEIKLNGFRQWRKKITIREQVVTFLPVDSPDKIPLFLENNLPATVATGTVDFFTDPTDEASFALFPKTIGEIGTQGIKKIREATSTVPALRQIIDAEPDATGKMQFLAADLREQIWYLSQQTTKILPPDLESPKLWKGRNALLALNAKKELWQIDFDQGNQELLQNVNAFTGNNDLYYIATPPDRRGSGLWQISPDGRQVLLVRDLPSFTSAQIVVTPAKEIFLLLDTDLYRVGEALQKINSEVDYVVDSPDLPALIYGNSHEVWLYSLEKQETELLTRSSEILGEAVYNKKTGYLFVAEGNKIKAIEKDPLGQPNAYTLVETQTQKPKFYLDPEGTMLIYKDGQALQTLKIR